MTVDTKRNESERDVETISMRARLPHLDASLGLLLSDWALALLFAAFTVVDFLHRGAPGSLQGHAATARYELVRSLAGEATFLVLCAPLLDFATRLKKRPPVWLIWGCIIVGALVYPPSRQALMSAWSAGGLVLIPLIVSIASRTALLRRLPGQPALERLTARALIANRMLTALGLLALLAIVVVAAVASQTIGEFVGNMNLALPAGAIYFAVAAWDNQRVRRPRFVADPTVMFRYDVLGIRKLDL